MKRKFYQITNKSLGELEVKTQKELWEKVKGDYKGLSQSFETVFVKSENSENKFGVTMSTADVDRHGEVVEQKWDLKNFKKNPVLLDSHNYDSIEHILGRVNKTKIKDNKLVGEIEFMLDNPKGLLAYKMALGGFLSATSVGFIPLDFNENGDIAKSELLELSAVSVPANAEALLDKNLKVEDEKKNIEVVEEVKEKDAEIDKIAILKRVAEKKERRRKEILKESLAVIQRLQSSKVDNGAKRRKMVNRVIKQLIKIK